jgi:hypothetical protein
LDKSSLRKTGWTRKRGRRVSSNASPAKSIRSTCAAALVEESLRGSPSYNDLAANIESNEDADPSRQAIALRLNERFEDFLEALLGEVIAVKVAEDAAAGRFAEMDFRGYRRVLVQDILNNAERTRVRLLAASVDPEIANLRRMRAKKETRGRKPFKAVLELMDWTIFITNIPTDKAGFQETLGIYGLRWRIEVIFKAWKSHLKFDVLHRVCERQLRILLKTRLLVIAAASNLYRRVESVLWLKYRRRLSLLKFMRYLAASLANLLRVICSLAGSHRETTALEQALARYCCYDKRIKRRNFTETWENLA